MTCSLHRCLDSSLQQGADLFAVGTTGCLHHHAHQRPHGAHAAFFDEVKPFSDDAVDDLGQTTDVGRRQVMGFAISGQGSEGWRLAGMMFYNPVNVVSCKVSVFFEAQNVGEQGRRLFIVVKSNAAHALAGKAEACSQNESSNSRASNCSA